MPKVLRSKIVGSGRPSKVADNSKWFVSAVEALPAMRSNVDKWLKERNQAGYSDFQLSVWSACSLVPPGMVATYGGISHVICAAKLVESSEINPSEALRRVREKGIGSLARGVGQALRRNPIAPTVPCHRVVSSDRRLHGFCGSTDEVQLRKKAVLLKKEGLQFGTQKTVDGAVAHVVVAPQCVLSYA